MSRLIQKQPKHDMDFLAPFVDKMQGHDVYLVVDSVTLDSVERLDVADGLAKAIEEYSEAGSQYDNGTLIESKTINCIVKPNALSATNESMLLTTLTPCGNIYI